MVAITEALRVDDDTGIVDDFWNIWTQRYAFASLLLVEVQRRPKIEDDFLRECTEGITNRIPAYEEFVRNAHPNEADAIMSHANQKNIAIEDRLGASFNRHIGRALAHLDVEKPETVARLYNRIYRYIQLALPKRLVPPKTEYRRAA